MEPNTPDFPRWTVTRDGREEFVHTTEELLALRGPFGRSQWLRGLSAVFADDRVVVAMDALNYAGWEFSKGEVFILGGRLEDPALLESKAVRRLSEFRRYTRHKHRPTGRFFVDEMRLHEYEQRYEAYMRGEAVVKAPAAERERQATLLSQQLQRRGRKEDYPDKETFQHECYRSYFELLGKSRHRKRPSMPMVAKNMKPDISEKTLRKNLTQWGIPYPPTAPSDRATVEDPPTPPQQ